VAIIALWGGGSLTIAKKNTCIQKAHGKEEKLAGLIDEEFISKRFNFM